MFTCNITSILIINNFWKYRNVRRNEENKTNEKQELYFPKIGTGMSYYLL